MESQELFHAVKAGYWMAKCEEESAMGCPGDWCGNQFDLVYNLWLEKGVSSVHSAAGVSRYPNTTQRHLKDPTKLSRKKKWQLSLGADKCKLLP